MPSIGGNTIKNNGVLTVESVTDFKNNTVKNLKLEADTELKNILVRESIIENCKVRNVSAEGLEMGFVEVEGLTVGEMKVKEGEVVVVGEGGVLSTLGGIKRGSGGSGIEIGLKVDFDNNELQNVDIASGKISGLASATIAGTVDVGGGLNVGSDVFVDGGLTVSGSVLGSGPYVDASDSRFKKEVEILGAGVLDSIEKLQGVSYKIDENSESSKTRRVKKIRGGMSEREIGFIAQEVEKVFPELVVESEVDGLKGVMYARLAPILVEGVKELREENRVLRREVEELRELLVAVMNKS